ncbi:MAG TPA: penicillin acylase family protein [Actinomycetota bacterium]|nr:penicillin acylase family protein [Actinomycetota bacterium]
MDEMTRALEEAAHGALPPFEGEVRLAGLRAPVEVLRDRWGVPHITAADEHDLWFAQGYVMASERLFQVDLGGRLATGRLSEVFGDLTLPLDRFVRTLGWHRTGRALADGWDERSLEMTEAFAAGVRAWVDTMPAPPPEYGVIGVEPSLPALEEAPAVAAATGAFVAWSLSRGWDNDLLRAEIAERIGIEAMRLLFPDVDPEPLPVVAGTEHPGRLELLDGAFFPPSDQGSNNWVVHGGRTTTGHPLLANDPHLAIQLPSAWYEVHLVAPGIDVAGVAFPFSPGVLIGHNERIAWGFTNGEGDVQDLFLERLSEDSAAAEFEGAWEPLTVHREEIAVRGRAEPDVLEVRESRHGPLLDSYTIGISSPEVIEGGIRRTYALRWVGRDHGVAPSVVRGLDMARDWDGFRAALAGWRCPGQNAVYADVDGNIGYQLTGMYPVRRRGDGTLPVPGWTGEYEWEGWIPFEELPRAYNPPDGSLLTANNRPHDDAYPHLIGKEFLPPFRARRIAERLAERDRHDRDSFASIQVDTVSLSARRLLPDLLSVEPDDDRQKQALAMLAEWDADLAAHSAPAALYQVWCARIAREVLLPLLGEELYTHFYARRQWTNGFLHKALPHLLAYPSATWFGRDGRDARDEALRRALDAALDELGQRFGDEPWRWGRIHRATFASQLARVPYCTELLTAGVVELGGDDQTVLQGLFEPGVPYSVAVLPSWRQILDPGDWDASVGVLTTGQAGNPVSPHFRDQFPLWSEGKHHPMPFTRAAVEAATIHRLDLLPAAAVND